MVGLKFCKFRKSLILIIISFFIVSCSDEVAQTEDAVDIEPEEGFQNVKPYQYF